MTARKCPTILLVDDDAAVRATLHHALSQGGYLIMVADDGREALARYEGHGDAIDLLITDLNMPNMGGLELAERLRRLQPDLPILFISGDSGNELLPSVEAFPNHLFVHKPFLPSEIVAHVGRILRPEA